MRTLIGIHTSNTKQTENIIFINLCIYIYRYLCNEEETTILGGDNGQETEGIQGKKSKKEML